MTSREVIAEHRAAGRFFEAGGIRSFVRESAPATQGDPVVCVHGVPTSSFLYRKVLAELAGRGLSGVAFDLPGLGLAERPAEFDYTWSGLGRFCAGAVDVLGLERFHLVVHDIGGPVGFELAAAMPDRVASLTLLNTMVAVDGFKRPWMMEPFARRGLGELWLASMTKPVFRRLMSYFGIEDGSATAPAEWDAHVELLKREDGGRAFLQIMRGFERTAEKQQLYERVLRDGRYPVQIVWGSGDPALTLAVHGEQARRAADLDEVHTVPAKHFLQEDQAAAIAQHVGELARG